ncbi:hypothetical protein QBC33DRAFT_156072 [Phialemonium atrogriseum]|uniref:Mid2 domain-containing protein n=1 Tax=Phialemonium atrogriseum TaxID=1093897 RepID=A0AAJ0C7D7_9PEZI|nr:uncharacterized protein QBC33DRAFT_156072 [Phialemonium atrogriseum]KAK1771518.1 hypothetical protein QBC33DRAFT_156072 [Phialemonium atrogriseum]
MRCDIFLLLPSPTALLLLASVFDLTSAHAIHNQPRQTSADRTRTLHTLDIVPFPPLPTSPPLWPFQLRRRQQPNTICGYIGGNPNLPATCSAGSHCVLDAGHGAVGCCPDDQEPCTTGVFTACVDHNSPGRDDEANADAYAFTCSGSDVCYRNEYEGGFFQFGCGSATDLAATVFATATGITEAVDPPSLSIEFVNTASGWTGSWKVTSASSPASSTGASSTGASSTDSSTGASSTGASSTDSSTGASSTDSSTDSSSSTSGTSTSSTRTSSPTPTPSSTSPSSTLTPPPPAATATSAPPTVDHGSSSSRTGAIVGGTISGVAALIALIAAGIYLWRRQQKRLSNRRLGPGVDPHSTMTEYISPAGGGGGGGGGDMSGGGFQPVHQSFEAWETGLAPGSTAGSRTPPRRPQRPEYYDPSDVMAGGGGEAAGDIADGGDRLHGDMVPLTREIDDFSRGFQDALGRIDEDDHRGIGGGGGPQGGPNGAGMVGTGGGGGGESGEADGEERPLWQQNRRLSRNMMWM